MNYSSFIVFDFETSSANPLKTQPVQIAAVAVHSRKLEIIKGSEFQSLIKPSFDEDFCNENDLDLLQDGAVRVHGKTREILEEAPSLKSVWANFTDYVNSHNWKGSSFSAPIAVGYNISGFDLPIVKRICCDDPWKYGPSDAQGRPSLFNPIKYVDLMHTMFQLFENHKDVNSLSADNLIRGYMGYSKGQAHDAMSDVIMTAEVFCRTQTMLRGFSSRKKFKDAFSE